MNQVKELFDFINSGGMSVYSGSRAASTPTEEPKHDVRITEVLNGLIVTRPARKYTDLSKPVQKVQEEQKQESGPVVIDLQEHAGKSKAGSYHYVTRRGINEVKELFDFMRHYGRI